MRPGGPNDSADLLLRVMEEISESSYAAGWMTELEYDLWAFATGDRQPTGGYAWLEQQNLDQLRDLAVRADGWWKWDATDGETFVPLDEWRRVYATRSRA